MIGALTSSLVWLAATQGQLMTRTNLPMPADSPTRLFIQANADPMPEPKKSPKFFGADKVQWLFPWVIDGYADYQGEKGPENLRFRVYTQEQRGDQATQVTRMLLRLWDFNIKRLKLLHNPEYHKGLVDVYLCFGGVAGGEQIFDVEPDLSSRSGTPPTFKVNTIYVYDMASFTDPVEMAREIAHEYGHATWPPFGGFKDPEEWAAGYLSEKIYLRWIRDALASGELKPEDAMGATKASLDKWISAHVDPLWTAAAQAEPTEARLANPSAAGMNAFIGLALYIEMLYPPSVGPQHGVFERSIKLVGSVYAKDYPAAAVLASEEPDQVTLKIPVSLLHKSIWIPLGTGRLSGAAILKTNSTGWALIQPGGAPITITNSR